MADTVLPMPDDGFFYDDFHVGAVLPTPPSVTVTSGLAAQYLAITGDALPLAIDAELSRAVTGSAVPLANPLMVMHLSTGASTVATRNVLANLFYRNLVFRRPVFEGETLSTTTSVLALADAQPKPGVAPRGKALLGIVTTGTNGLVLDYQRSPLLPCRGETAPGHADDITGGSDDLAPFLAAAPDGWDLSAMPASPPWAVGERRTDPMRDVIDQATGLVRLTHNLATAHRDAGSSVYGERLVYGGHPVSLAQASLIRVHPGIATILGWLECSHLGPAFEGDTMSFTHELIAEEPGPHGGRVRVFSVDGHATAASDTATSEHRRIGPDPRHILTWRVAVLTT